MIDKRLRLGVLLGLAAVVIAAVVWWGLPRIVAALPGRLRHYVPTALVELATTPLPTALPAPAEPAPAALELALATVTPTDTPPPSATLSPVAPTGGGLAATLPTTLPTPIPSPTTHPLPPYGRIDDLPIIPQKFNNCGPTNLTIVLNHYGIDVDQFDVAAVARPNYEDRNVSPDELVRYVREQTPLSAAAYVGGDLDQLRHLIAAGFPVIIEKGLEPDEATGWMGHYLTVYGYDDITRHLLVRDTYLGPWRGDGLASYDDTERYWAQFNGAFIVVYPPEREAELAGIVGAVRGDPAAMWSAAADRARATVTLAPDDAFAWFNLGSSLTALAGLGDIALYQGAAAAYDQARLLGLPARMVWYQFGPYEAYLAVGRHTDVLALADSTLANQGGRNVEETYYYQGRGLTLAGDSAGARAAFEQAAALNPDSVVGRAALAALQEVRD